MSMFHFLKVLIINALCYKDETWNKKTSQGKYGEYIRQYPNFIGMFKKIIVDKAINQVLVRYNINVNREER